VALPVILSPYPATVGRGEAQGRGAGRVSKTRGSTVGLSCSNDFLPAIKALEGEGGGGVAVGAWGRGKGVKGIRDMPLTYGTS
jgi:hypothetical protein